jgi:hypothetical protein
VTFVKIRYENSIEDLVVFNRYHWDHSSRSRRTKLVLLSVPPLLVLLPAVGGALWVQIPWPYVVGATVVLVVLYLLVAPGAFNRALERQVRRMYGRGANAAILGEHELELTETNLIERTPEEESLLELSAIERVASTPTHTLIYLNRSQAHVIPRDAVLEGDYDEFVAALVSAVPDARPETG